MTPLLSLIAVILLPFALAAPKPDASIIHVPIVRRSQPDRVINLPKVIEALRNKYGNRGTVKSANSKRAASVGIPLTDELNDNTYSGVMSIGTPPQTFNIVLDTGSADFWVATTSCTTCASNIPLFDPSKSSTYFQADPSLMDPTQNITYGLGEVNGTISMDTVTFGGFTVPYQEFLAVTSGTTSLLISNGLSGLMGLSFASVSVLNTTPFWEALYHAGQLSEPLFSFYLERYINQPLMDSAPGGILTLGGTNSSLYQGSIEYLSLTRLEWGWLLNVSSITVQGKMISIPTSSGYAFIDTATTLIGAPTSIAANIWSQVPGSKALDGEYTGLYAFPCNTSVAVSMSFGGTDWKISPLDINVGTVSSGMCAGAIFDAGVLDAGEFSKMWLVGDTFLKNVYSVFRAEPPAVGFAQLASGLSSSSGTFDPNPVQSGSLPAPTTSGGSSGGVLIGAASVSLTLLAIVTACFALLL